MKTQRRARAVAAIVRAEIPDHLPTLSLIDNATGADLRTGDRRLTGAGGLHGRCSPLPHFTASQFRCEHFLPASNARS